MITTVIYSPNEFLRFPSVLFGSLRFSSASFANFENHLDAQRAISELNGYQMGASTRVTGGSLDRWKTMVQRSNDPLEKTTDK